MKHIDLFSGIGGFSLAFDTIFHEQKNEHIFCEINPFCQAVLKKHWPEASFVSDIKRFTPDSFLNEHRTIGTETSKKNGIQKVGGKTLDGGWACGAVDILTGGFPCQPFSQAGRRKGTADDRYLWPEMFRVICDWKPTWVIAENVRGLVTWNEGMVLEQVCSDLEREGYEVQPLIIPAVAVNAPHRRDRVWIIAAYSGQLGPRHSECRGNDTRTSDKFIGSIKTYGSNSSNERLQRCKQSCGEEGKKSDDELSHGRSGNGDWSKNWLEVATRLCRVDDGLPRRMDRNPRLKALGNAIVPQVAEEIMLCIKSALAL